MERKFRWIGLSADSSQVLLRKFTGEFPFQAKFSEGWVKENSSRLRKAAVLDVETTGLDPHSDCIIEIAVRTVFYDPTNGNFVRTIDSYQGLQDPGKPLDPEISRLTGLTDEDLRGQAIDWGKVESILQATQIIIAHNASFDRPFVEKRANIAKKLPWACSMSQVDWAAKGFTSRKLEVLSIYHGFFVDAHRALADVDATVYLLSFADALTQRSYFAELLETARKPLVRVVAANSPFETKDHLKRRGYHWEAERRYWYKRVFKELVQEEVRWMEEKIYNGNFRGTCEEIPLEKNFSAS